MTKHLIYLFWLTLSFHTTDLVSQNYYTEFKKVLTEFEGATLRMKVDSLLKICEHENDLQNLEKIAMVFAMKNQRGGDLDRAIYYGKIAQTAVSTRSPGSKNHVGITLNVGQFHRDNRQYSEAIKYYDKIITIGTIPFRTAQAHAEIGNCYRHLGDYFKSVDYYQRGLEIFLETKKYSSLIIHSINLAWTYENIGTAESLANREKVLLKADSLITHYEIRHWNYIRLKNSIAYQYTLPAYFDFDKARDIYFTNLNKGLSLGDTATLSMTYNNLANLYNLEKRDSASYFANKGLELVSSRSDRARLNDNLSDYFLHQGKLLDALSHIHTAIETSLKVQIPLSEAPNAQQLNDSDAKDYVMYCLSRKTEILKNLYAQTKDRKYSQQVINHVMAADLLSQMISGNSFYAESKLFWRKEASKVYLLGAEAAIIMEQPERSFYFMEKNKAMLLAEEISSNSLVSELPLELAKKEQFLKGEVLALEATNEGEKVLFEARKEYDQIKDTINLLYPDYVRRQLDIIIQDLSSTQKSLKKDQLMISYIWNRPDFSQEKIIGMAISQKSVSTFEVIADDEWHALIARFRNLVSKPLQTQEELTDFHNVSHQLYQSLLPEQFRNGEVSAKELIIVPDGALQNLPFEALITNAENPEYLVESVDLRYLYSYSFLKYNQQRVRKETEGKILAYAPIEFSEEGLPELPYSGKEAQAVAMALDGEVRLNDQASKASFLNQSQDYKVLHLATHADAGEDHWIAFADDRLNLYELYTYENNADLVVLSGCNTLLGEIVRGEGVLSLARGFFYSGSQTVIASVWNTNDYAMSELMTSFYENLSEGKGKSEALNMAKRQYLANHKLSEASPYYWAAPLLIGDPNKVVEGTPKLLYWLALVLAIILAAAVGRRARKKSA